MNIKNKKGFTLVELLAVVIVLIVIIFLALNKVNQSTKKTKNNAIKANGLAYIKSVNQLIDEDATISSRLKNITFNNTNDLDQLGIKISGQKPDSVYIIIDNYEIEYACLVYGKKYVTYEDGSMNEPKKGSCPTQIALSKDFEYTGTEETFIAGKSGNYTIEAWGAQGGSSLSYNQAFGGYGGYATGTIYLNKGDTIYINVGGVGTNGDNTSTTKAGGYNGGGAKVSPDSAYYGSAGGGATHVSFSSGLLSSLSSDVQSIIIVAGGGGGGAGISGNYGYGGSGGGYKGGNGLNALANTGWGAGGSQTAPGCINTSTTTNCGSFGKGNGTSGGHGGAGGGGFYGGGATNSGNIGGGGGGSGYIGNVNLEHKVMYCYNCPQYPEENTLTISTTCFNDEPTPNCAKKGNGYVKIYLYTGE